MTIAGNLDCLKTLVPEGVAIIAVSKMQPVERIREAYDAGHRIFGENRVQELLEKQPFLPAVIEWHFIGHLQTNKVRYIAPFIHCIHSIDSLKLLAEVNRSALKHDRVIDCLLQFHIAMEETKYGFNLPEAEDLLACSSFRELKNVRITGVMGMATYTDDMEKVRSEFRTLKGYFDLLKAKYFPAGMEFREVSMGMSGDFRVAIEEGSTMVRIGTALFGNVEPTLKT